MPQQTDVLVIGGGLAGLVAATEAAGRGRQVVVVDQENEANLGGQAFWSLGGLFMIDTPEQRRMRIKDSYELARQDWLGAAAFDRDEDHWPRQWAEAYLSFAAGDMRAYLLDKGMSWFPVVGWAERGGSLSEGHGNSVPRFHLTWGTGTGVVAPFERLVRQGVADGKITLLFRHKVTALTMENGAVVGASGQRLADAPELRGHASNRDVVGDFDIRAESVVVASGGVGGNFAKVRELWPTERLGPAPDDLISGVPAHVDGEMIETTAKAGARVINEDRMWHYCEGVRNFDPIWPHHGIRILPGPSSLWFDALGERMQPPAMPGFDTMSSLKRILSTGHSYSWFILNQKIIEKEFALSGSEQNPDLTSGSWRAVLKARLGKGATPNVEAFKEQGEDFLVDTDLERLVGRMNALVGSELLNPGRIRSQIEGRDAQMTNKFSKDAQIMAIHSARNFLGDKLMRTAKPHRILDPAAGPLIAVRLNVLTRKTLGGIETNLDSQALGADGAVIPGLYAAGEAAGFGGGGYHGYNSLEGTFLGGCIFSGRAAGLVA